MTRIATLILVTALALALANLGCGGGDGTPTSSPEVDGKKQMLATNAGEQTMLCDWYAGLLGGYGTAKTCTMGFISAPPTLSDCLAHFPACAVTVSTFEICINDVISAQETCTSQALTQAQMSSACQTVGQAGCFPG